MDRDLKAETNRRSGKMAARVWLELAALACFVGAIWMSRSQGLQPATFALAAPIIVFWALGFVKAVRVSLASERSSQAMIVSGLQVVIRLGVLSAMTGFLLGWPVASILGMCTAIAARLLLGRGPLVSAAASRP
jgi:hypothetical protein